MNSFILIAKNSDTRKTYIESFCIQQAISTFDQTVISSETPSIGIEIIRDMQKSIYFKPLKGEKKLILLENAHTLTTEAQNALLKILEEPPLHTYFFLSAVSSNAFLPTILSRCKVLLLEEEKKDITDEAANELLKQYQQLTTDTIGYKLSLAEKLSGDKQKTQEWLETMIHVLHKHMLSETTKQKDYAIALFDFQNAYTTIQTTNVNLRLLLEHIFLTLF